jgi:hypothetical protein
VGEAAVLATLSEALQRTGVDPARIVVEVTETALTRADADPAAFLSRLRDLGCGVALDDFGTGYNGFSRVKHLPVDVLKIDQQFVHDLLEDPASAGRHPRDRRPRGRPRDRGGGRGHRGRRHAAPPAELGVTLGQGTTSARRPRSPRCPSCWSAWGGLTLARRAPAAPQARPAEGPRPADGGGRAGRGAGGPAPRGRAGGASATPRSCRSARGARTCSPPIRDHQVVVVAGETGSGKTTQLPKICLELGRGVRGQIAHTQPRRIAARTVADGSPTSSASPLGSAVGFAVRFDDRSSDDTLVKLMTDGLLLAEIQRDRLLRRYDTIIVDEAARAQPQRRLPARLPARDPAAAAPT